MSDEEHTYCYVVLSLSQLCVVAHEVNHTQAWVYSDGTCVGGFGDCIMGLVYQQVAYSMTTICAVVSKTSRLPE